MNAVERASCLILAVFGLGVVAIGCGEESDSSPATPTPSVPIPPPAVPTPTPSVPPTPDASDSAEVSPADTEAGHADYQIYCASCHGPTGGGDGPVAASLPIKPAKHDDGQYMNPLTDEYLFRVIAEGGPAVGKSEMMAPWGGSLSDSQIRNLIAFIRSLADPPYSP